MMMRFAVLVLLAVSLNACTARHYKDTTDSSGITADSHAAQTPRETCFGSCTRDYNVCMDETSNSRETMPGMGASRTAGRGCELSMKDCQKRCSAL